MKGKNKAANLKDTQQAIQRLVALFKKNVKGKITDTSTSHKGHDGKDGHWLETQMNVAHNRATAPDIESFEMKNHTTSGKTTFGDWSADQYIFNDPKSGITRDDFMRIFGSPNEAKGGRFSWSGKPCPKISGYNDFGQVLRIDKTGNILALYNYGKDRRTSKNKIVPNRFKKDRLILARWDAVSMKKKVEDKFMQRGWFKVNKDKSGAYDSIVFGGPITFKSWLAGVRAGEIYLDSGMHQGNYRNYSQWRANNKWWDTLIISRY